MHRFASAVTAAAFTSVGVLAATTAAASGDTSTPTTEPTTDATTSPVDDTSAGTGVEDTMADDTSSEDTTASNDAAATSEPATVFDESGDAVATIAFLSAEVAWGDYEEDNEPEAGREYVQVVVNVESMVTEGAFEVSVDDFILQDNNGFVTEGESVASAEQAEADEDITESAELANGEAVELTVTFEVSSTAGPNSVFYRPEDDRLVDVADIG